MDTRFARLGYYSLYKSIICSTIGWCRVFYSVNAIVLLKFALIDKYVGHIEHKEMYAYTYFKFRRKLCSCSKKTEVYFWSPFHSVSQE